MPSWSTHVPAQCAGQGWPHPEAMPRSALPCCLPHSHVHPALQGLPAPFPLTPRQQCQLLRPILQGLQASGRCSCGLRGDRVRGSLVSWGTCEMLAAPIRWLWCSAWMERGGQASSAPCSCASGMGTGAVVPFIGCVFLMHFGSLRAAAGEPIVVMELGLAAGARGRVRT